MPQYSFVTDGDLSPRLQNRLDKWRTLPPRSQYQQYGPLNMFLTAKFDAESFIVKPQALLRDIVQVPAALTEDQIQGVMSNAADTAMDTDEIQEVKRMMGLGHKSTLSTDSYGSPVMSASRTEKKYPDFVVTAYRDLISQGNTMQSEDDRFERGPDAVRLIVEVASTLGREDLTKNEVSDLRLQITRYLRTMGDEGQRWQNYAAGIVIHGDKFFAIEPGRHGDFDAKKVVKWSGLNSDAFIKIINKAQKLDSHW